MKTKTYRHSRVACKSYIKNVGFGWEVGFIFGSRPIFVGNFINAREAKQWYALMNREIRTFARRYTVGRTCPTAWFTHFFGSHLYRTYYNFLDRVFTKHHRTYAKAVNRDLRRYRQLSKRWYPRERTAFLKAA